MSVDPLPVRGERYFVARTERGQGVVNYQPDTGRYIAGPFDTRQAAGDAIDTRHRTMLNRWVVAAIAGVGLIILTNIVNG